LNVSPGQLVVTYETEANRVYSAVSTDGGATFNGYTRLDSTVPNPESGSIDVRPVVDGTGNLWVVWHEEGLGMNFLMIRHSDNGGLSYGPVYRVNRDLPPGGRYSGFVLESPLDALPGVAFVGFLGDRDSHNRDGLVNAFDLNDFDRDQSPTMEDCDDENPNIFPGATEICGNGIDEDCTGADLPCAAELVVDLGAGGGLYSYFDNTSWHFLQSRSPDSVTIADLDGDGFGELVADLGAAVGIRIYTPEDGWRDLHGLSPEQMASGDLDGNGQDELIVDFGSGLGLALYALYNGSQWRRLHGISPETMVAGDMDGNGKDELIVDFGSGSGRGIYVYYNDAYWNRLHASSPEEIVVGDVDGNGEDDLIVDFGPESSPKLVESLHGS